MPIELIYRTPLIGSDHGHRVPRWKSKPITRHSPVLSLATLLFNDSDSAGHRPLRVDFDECRYAVRTRAARAPCTLLKLVTRHLQASRLLLALRLPQSTRRHSLSLGGLRNARGWKNEGSARLLQHPSWSPLQPSETCPRSLQSPVGKQTVPFDGQRHWPIGGPSE